MNDDQENGIFSAIDYILNVGTMVKQEAAMDALFKT
jgi:hypothetical protein